MSCKTRIKQALEPKWHTVKIMNTQLSRYIHEHCMPKLEPEFDPGIPNLPNTLIPKPNS